MRCTNLEDLAHARATCRNDVAIKRLQDVWFYGVKTSGNSIRGRWRSYKNTQHFKIELQNTNREIMLNDIIPKLPMRDKNITRAFYVDKLEFQEIGNYEAYLMVRKDKIEIHFFEFKELNPKENYGQVYIRVKSIDDLYQKLIDNKIKIHPNGNLESKPWGQKEFSLLDPDTNLLTFGENV